MLSTLKELVAIGPTIVGECFMYFFKIVCLLCCLYFPLSRCMDASWRLPMSDVTGVCSDRLALIDDVVTQAIEQRQTPGAVVLVGHKGKVVYHKAFGVKIAESTPVPMSIDTIFDIASLTKPIVMAVWAVKLIEQGIVKLDDVIARYLPEFDVPDKKMITIEQLLTHRAGFPAELSLAPCKEGKDACIKFLAHQPLMYTPGSSYI